MKKTLLITLAATGAIFPAMSVTLTAEEALARYLSDGPGMAPAKNGRTTLHLDATIGNLFIFKGDEGFVVLPSQDGAPSLLAYSDSGEFDMENPGLRYWMDYYNDELEYLKSLEQSCVKGTDTSRNFAEDSGKRKGAVKERAEIEPLLKTFWNQESPYNMLCPKVDGHETVTGCVATAMAQVMKYHNYPEHGKGTHSYFWRPGEEELSFNYDSIPFRWDLMENKYDRDSSEESKRAVAELMLGCGVSVDMHYEPGGSGAATMQMGASLIDIFGYSKSLWMPNRDYYGLDEWQDMIYADLAEGLPVLYSGAGTAGGHQFVCDGYKDDGFFHINWGWGGLSNGYFLLTALNPDDLGVGGGAGGFNTTQIATLGVRPGKEGDKPVYLFYNTTSFLPDVKEVKKDEDFRCTGQYFNFGLSTMPGGSRLGMKFVSEETGSVIYAEGPDVEGYHPDDGRNDLQVRFPDLSDGRYEITPALLVDGEWSEVRVPLGNPGIVYAAIKDGVATLSSADPASIYVSDIILPDTIYRNHEFPMQFTVENIGDGEFYSTITPMLLDSTGQPVSKSVFRPVDILMGEKETISDYIGKFTAEADHSFAPGNYTLIFRDEAGKTVSDPMVVDVAVNDDRISISITGLHLEGGEIVSNPDDVEVIFSVECVSGVYFGKPMFSVFPGDGGYELFHVSSDGIYLTPGEKMEVKVKADMSDLKDGSYMAVVYNDGEVMTDRLHFEIRREAGDVDSISINPSGKVVYDMNGVKHNKYTAPGIYIRDGKKILITK